MKEDIDVEEDIDVVADDETNCIDGNRVELVSEVNGTASRSEDFGV